MKRGFAGRSCFPGSGNVLRLPDPCYLFRSGQAWRTGALQRVDDNRFGSMIRGRIALACQAFGPALSIVIRLVAEV
jgi:hypothetical protein